MTRTLPLLALVLAGCAAGEPGLSIVETPDYVTADGIPCVDRAEAKARYEERYGKTVAATGHTFQGMIIEILANDDGEWTEIRTFGNCTKLTATGEGWQSEAREYRGPEA